MLKQRLVILIVLTIFASGCAAGRAFRRGQEAARSGDWDSAVAHYTRALQESPDKAEYKIELERAMQNAAREHIARARDFELKGDIDAALLSYRKAIEMDSSNRLAASKAIELERAIRDRIEKIAAEAGNREAARAGAAAGDAHAEPDDAAAEGAIHQRQPARRAHLHRHAERHQRPVRSAVLPRRAGHGGAGERHRRRGAAADPVDARALLQGAQPDHDRRGAGQRAGAPEVRRPGRADLLSVARRRAGNRADHQHRHAHPEHDGRAGDVPEQDVQLAYGSRDRSGGQRHRAGDPRQRQAARGSRRRRADPRSEPHTAEGIRHRPERLRGQFDLLAGAGAAEYASHAGRRVAVAAAVQPEHDLAGHQHRRLLSRAFRRPYSGSSSRTRTRACWPSRSCAAPKAGR